MKLHYAPNTVAVASAIALEEAGLDYTPVKVDFASAAQTKPDYLQVNPKARVPALETGKGILTETGAILEYIASQAPDAGLMPSDPWDAAQVRSVLHYLAATMHVNHAHKMRGSRWATEQSSFEDMQAKVPETMTASAAFVEETCLTGPFVRGDGVTIADAHLFILCSWLGGDGVDVAAFPKISAFLAAMEARDSVKAVRAKGILTL